MHCLFCLYHFNDIDHISPIIWKCLQAGERCTVLYLDPEVDTSEDPRLKLLRSFEAFDETTVESVLGPSLFFPKLFFPQGKSRTPSFYWRKFLEKTGQSLGRAEAFLKDKSIDLVVFEWGGAGSRNRQEIFQAAERLGLPTVVFPHGLNIFINDDMTQFIGQKIRDGKPLRQSRNRFDAYVVQSEFHKAQEVATGLREEKGKVLGSTRFCPEWAPINASLYEDFSLPVDGEKKRVVFMLPHWTYNVAKAKTLELISHLLQLPNVYTVLKPHTRNSHIIPEELTALAQGASERCRIETAASSTALIRWADAVICFGSSIGLDALLHNTTLINPAFCHDNRTIFEHWGGEWNAANLEEVEALIFQDNEQHIDASHPLLKEVVFGGKPSRDVLDGYYQLLLECRAARAD